ncbi:hypothetical protein [Azospirillum canadense]|uniref:hypothetical protein n=1 Tax=Azospirillum canadense TaxID=403962 RepID=UPI0022275F83|nr:hypothetical protein [Azospirillum canadense]MCW2239149.1 hypothetical protein [Azospirillum canadense]
MGHAHYLVAQRGAGWFILLGRNRYGPFPNGRNGALTAAVQAANQAGKDGHDARVSLRAVDGSERTLWSFGTDGYPPCWVEQLRIKAPKPRPARPRPAALAPSRPEPGGAP